MRINWDVDKDLGLTSIRREPGEYDSSGGPQLLTFDVAPERRDPDRFAVAAALLFADSIEGTMSLPSALAPLTSISIEQYLAPSTVSVGPVDSKPRRIPIGVSKLVVTDGYPSPVTRGLSGPREVQLVPLRADEHAGGLHGVDHLYVVSNHYMFHTVDDAESEARVRLGLAVLYAEDAGADSVELRVIGPVSREWVEAHRELLGAVGLGLDVKS